MSDNTTCENCFYWSRQPAIATGTRRPDGASPHIGVCVAASPCVVQAVNGWVSVFPETHKDRWCRDWVPDDPLDSGDDDEESAAEPSTVVEVDFRR